MTDEQIGYFLGRIKGLPKGTKIDLKRSLGTYYDSAPPALKFSIMYGVPDGFYPNDDTMQNLYFTAAVACTNGDGMQEKAERAVTSIIRDEEKRRAAGTDFSNSRMSEILSCRTGKHGDIYKKLGDILYGSGRNIDCFSLLKDLDSWKFDSTRRRWASAYIRERKDTENE